MDRENPQLSGMFKNWNSDLTTAAMGAVLICGIIFWPDKAHFFAVTLVALMPASFLWARWRTEKAKRQSRREHRSD